MTREVLPSYNEHVRSLSPDASRRNNLVAAIRNAMEDARTASPVRARTTPGMQEARFIPQDTTRSVIASLSGESLLDLFDDNGRLRRTPHAAPSTHEMNIKAAVIAGARVTRAGAGLIVLPEASKPHLVGKTGDVALERVPKFVRNVESAEWKIVDIDAGDEVTISDSPISSVEIDLANADARAICFEVTRRERMGYADQEALCRQIVAAITLGLQRAADATLLSALTAANLQPFTLAAAAAADLHGDELRALVGTSATGAAFGTDGVLRAAGVPAELSPDMAGTIVGAWNRAAVAVRDDVTILFNRVGNAGKMQIIAWTGMQACIPSAERFWIVAEAE